MKLVLNALLLFFFVITAPANAAYEDLVAPSLLLKIRRDLREKLISAIDSALNIGSNPTEHGRFPVGWDVRAIDLYRALGVSEAEVAAKVEKRLNQYLEVGRAKGLSSKWPVQCGALLVGSLNSSAVISGSLTNAGNVPFVRRYDLKSYKKLQKNIGKFDRWAVHPYAESLDHAFRMASKIGNRALATEALLHILRFGNYERAYKIAEAHGEDRALITIGFLSLVDFFEGSHRDSIHKLWIAIESFKRVQGPLKGEANQIMYDLAMKITNDVFMGRIQPRHHHTYLKYGLRLLRSTGQLLMKLPIDPVMVNFVTKVHDPRAIKAIRDLIQKMPDKTSDEVREARAAIGDEKALNARREDRTSTDVHSIPLGVREFLKRQDLFRKMLDDAWKKATPERIAEYKIRSTQFLAVGDSQNAFLAAIEALDYDGLVAVGDFLLKKNDGFEALSPYLAAACLLQMQ